MNFVKRTKIGTYTLVMSAIVLAVLVTVNLLVLNAPSKYTKLDITSQNLYTLSEATKDAVSGIDENIDIFFICSGGEDGSGSSIDNMPQLSLFLQRYAELNGKINYQMVDPIESPTFTDEYASDGVGNYSIIVKSAKRHKAVNLSDLYYYYGDGIGRISVNQYQSVMYSYYYQTGTYPSLSLHFDGENLITSALDYVTTDRIPVIYTLEGHGETALSETLLANIKSDSIEVKTLNLLTSSMPDDAEMIIINVPTSDINADEAATLKAYLENGGSVFLNTIYSGSSFNNLIGLLSEYGLSPVSDLIIEGDSNLHYTGYPFYLLPKASTESPITASLASSVYMFMPYSHGIISGGETNKNLTSTPLFSTSDLAYTIAPDAENTEKTENSVAGPFDVAVLCEDNDSGAKIIWFGAPSFDDSVNSITGGNYKYFMSALSESVERDRIGYDISANEIASSTLVVSAAEAGIWSIIFVILIPLAFVVIGIARWAVRRRK